MNYQEEILKLLNESLLKEENADNRKEIADVIKVLTEQSLYAAAIFDFFTLAVSAKIGGLQPYYDIPEVRQAFYDKIANPNIEPQNKNARGAYYDIIYFFTDKLSSDTFKTDPNFIPFIENADFEQCDRLFSGNATAALLDEKLYYDIIVKKSLIDERFISLLPYNEMSMSDDNYKRIILSDLDGDKLSKATPDIQIRLFAEIAEVEGMNLSRYLMNFEKLERKIQEAFIKTQKLREKLIKYNAENEYKTTKIPSELEESVVTQSIDYINGLSFKEKYVFIGKLQDPVYQKYIMQKIHFMKNLLSMKDFYRFFDKIKDETYLVECITEKYIISNLEARYLINIMEGLSRESLKLLTQNENFKEYYKNLGREDQIIIISICGEETIDNIIENNENLKQADYIKFFQMTKNHKYLQKVIDDIKAELENPTEEVIKSIQKFLGASVLESYQAAEVLALLTDEEFEYFLSIYNQKPEAIYNATSTLEHTLPIGSLTPKEQEILQSVDRSSTLSKEQIEAINKARKNLLTKQKLKEALTFIKSVPERTIQSFHYGLLDELTPEEQNIFLEHMSYECLLENIASCKIIVDYCENLLKNDPNVFNQVTIKENSYIYHSGDNLDEESLKKLCSLYKTMNDQTKEKILNVSLLRDEEIYREIFEKIANDPDSISGKIYKKVLQEFIAPEQLKTILLSLSFENFKLYCDTSSSTFGKDAIEDEVIILRQDEIIEKANILSIKENRNNYYFVLIKNIIDMSQNKEAILARLAPNIILEQYRTSASSDNDKATNELIINYLKNNLQCLLNASPNKIKEIMSELNSQKLTQFISGFNINELICIFAKSQNTDLESKIVEEFAKKPYFINDTGYTIEELLSRFEEHNKNSIYSKIESQFDELAIPYNIKNKLRKSSLDEKMFLIYGIKENIFTDEKLKHISTLLDKDPFALNSLKIQLFQPEIYNLSKNIIDKIYRYQNLTLSYINIILKKDNKSLVMLLLLEYLNKTTQDEHLFANKMNCIIKYLATHNDEMINDFVGKSVTEQELQALEEYIMLNTSRYWINGERMEIYSRATKKENKHNAQSFVEYEEKRIAELDQIALEEHADYSIIANCIFQKYFKLDLSQAKLLLDRYNFSYDLIKTKITNKSVIEYYESIRSIYHNTDIEELRHIYFEGAISHDLDEVIMLIEEFTKAYNLVIAESLKGYQNGQKGHIRINDESSQVEVIELDSNFELIVHSTDAYGSMQMINDNYFESWNFSERTANHGICTSFISASNLGTANVKGKGVMFGFNKLNEKSINLMAPYDIVSQNDDFLTTSVKPPMFVDVKGLADYTRHTHNELVLERRNVTRDSEYSVIQPDYIVIFEEMPQEIKENSIKAQADFAARGIHLPIIYINRRKVVEIEAAKVKEMLNAFESTHDLRILLEIINKYESNRCGLDFEKGLNVSELFEKDRIYSTILNEIAIIKNNHDYERAKELIWIIEHENSKFQLIIDQNPDRAHRFDLLDERLTQELEDLKNLLNQQKEIPQSGLTI